MKATMIYNGTEYTLTEGSATLNGEIFYGILVEQELESGEHYEAFVPGWAYVEDVEEDKEHFFNYDPDNRWYTDDEILDTFEED